jgi:hypothetical protein
MSYVSAITPARNAPYADRPLLGYPLVARFRAPL